MVTTTCDTPGCKSKEPIYERGGKLVCTKCMHDYDRKHRGVTHVETDDNEL